MIEFEVPGKPRPQGSKRHVGKGRMIESSPYVAAWREMVACMAHQEMQRNKLTCHPKGVPIIVYARLYFERPACHFKKSGLKSDAPLFHAQKPDVDKVSRAILDGLTGIVFADDSQVIRLDVHKNWYDRDYTIIRVGEAPW